MGAGVSNARQGSVPRKVSTLEGIHVQTLQPASIISTYASRGDSRMMEALGV